MVERLLEGKVAIVTGGSHGIGKATALTFASHGADVVVAARGKEKLVQAAAEIKALGSRSLALVTDVTQEDDTLRMAQEALAAFGHVDILVNCAGTTTPPSVHVWETTVKEWDRVMNANVRGTFLACRALLPHMVQRRSGFIINIASVVARPGKASSRQGAYTTSKWAVTGYTASLAKSVRPYGICVNVISPGPVDTGLIRREDFPDVPWSAPEEVAKVALFLVTAAPQDMTGQSIDTFNIGYVTG